jgi:hypothetical protein
MSIKYNEFGEVISVNGITTGHHLGTPMQDAIAEKPEDNEAYGTELNTVSRLENTVDDKQPEPQGGGNGGGSGGSTVEGTAIPVGEPVERIYFNTNLSVEEVNSYLSQLTYVDVGVETPIHAIYAAMTDGTHCLGMFVAKSGDFYEILTFTSLDFSDCTSLYRSYDGEGGFINYSEPEQYLCGIKTYSFPSVTDFNGIPVGAENEKIKNVLSITPF